MISKDVFQEVMQIKLKDGWDDITIKDNKVSYWLPDGEYFIPEDINVYELSHKCKEWAFKRELNLWTDYLGNCQIQDKEFQLLHDCYSDTEIEAIIKACEWILKDMLKH